MKRMDYDESTEKLAKDYFDKIYDDCDFEYNKDWTVSKIFRAGRLSARESLAIALRALEKTEKNNKAVLRGDMMAKITHADLGDIQDAIAEITKRGDYIPEGKG